MKGLALNSNIQSQLLSLRKAVEDWMGSYEMSDNCGWYTPEAWAVKEGSSNCLEGAKLILWFENELYVSLNYGDGVIADELRDLAGKFGYSYEQGGAWNLGLYEDKELIAV